MTIRRATVADVPAMGQIINDCAELGLMLPRSLSSMYENVREFHVAEEDGGVDSGGDSGGGRVVGVCGLSVVWANLAEVCALAVEPGQRGLGLGRKLTEACVAEARVLGVRTIMTLTYEKAFFERLGFSVVDRQQLPLKVWSECIRCPKNQACDEIAMTLVLEDVPELGVPRPIAPPADQYVVPIIRAMKNGNSIPPEDDD
jgi:amino-acid N-acetyltransferase